MAVGHLRQRFGVSERRACKLTGQSRSTQRKEHKEPSSGDEELTLWLKAFALEHPRWGYKRAFHIAVTEGWQVNIKRVHRLWREAELKVPYRKKKKPMVGNGAAMGAHQATAPNVCWAMDFQFDQTANTRPLKILNIIDEYSRECLVSFVARSITAADVTAVLDDLLSQRGRPIYLRCDNGPEFIANVVADWSREVGTTLWFIEPGSPWQNGRVESFNGRLRDEMLNGELFESVKEAQVLLDRWRTQYNTYRPHSSLGHLAPEQFLTKDTQEQRRILRQSRKSSGWLRRQELLVA